MSKVIYHLTSEHIFYLQSTTCFLTLKADGYYKNEYIDELDCNCEYESVNNKKFIFNVLDDNTDIQSKIFNLANKLDVKYPNIFKEEVNKNNFFEIINQYLNFYDNFDKNIIPKFYLKINKNELLNILDLLNNYFPETGFPNDGWVIVPKNEKFIAKLKPINHLTIDLKYVKGKFYASNWIEVLTDNRLNLKNNSVYRCYWENNKWIPKE